MKENTIPTEFKINIQLFADDEDDAILPDDSVETDLPESDEITPDNDVEETKPTIEQETKPVEQVEKQQPTPNTLKVKFNHEEKELNVDEAIPLIQKGMNYEKVLNQLQELQNDPRLSLLNEILADSGYEDPTQFMQDYRANKEQQALNELVQKNIPQELAQEILENRKYRKQQEAERKAKQAEETKSAEYKEFFTLYPDAKAEDIPQEVWAKNQNGIPLKYAYMEYKLNQLEEQNKVLKQNNENKSKAPIGATASYGSNEATSEDAFLEGFNSI